jgi:hypothetical protein
VSTAFGWGPSLSSQSANGDVGAIELGIRSESEHNLSLNESSIRCCHIRCGAPAFAQGYGVASNCEHML